MGNCGKDIKCSSRNFFAEKLKAALFTDRIKIKEEAASWKEAAHLFDKYILKKASG